MPNETKDFVVNGATLAEFFKCSSATAQRRAADGRDVKAPGRDKYLWIATLEKTCQLLEAKLAEAAEFDDPEMRAAKLGKLEAERRIAERRDDVERKSLIPADILEAQWSGLIIGCRNNFLALPARATLHLGLDKQQSKKLLAMVRDVLLAS